MSRFPQRKSKLIEQCGQEFRTEAVHILHSWKLRDCNRAWCHVHQRYCRMYPSPDQIGDGIWLECSGTPCVAWSLMGTRSGWLHEAAVTVLIWSRLMQCLQPHLILYECTPGFRFKDWEKLLGPAYRGHTALLCTSDLGLPSKRLRRYSLFSLRATTDVHESWCRDSLSLFSSRVDVGLSFYMKAIDQEVRCHHEKLAVMRSLAVPRTLHGRQLLS